MPLELLYISKFKSYSRFLILTICEIVNYSIFAPATKIQPDGSGNHEARVKDFCGAFYLKHQIFTDFCQKLTF